jgi:molybdopterin molybdotransferase
VENVVLISVEEALSHLRSVGRVSTGKQQVAIDEAASRILAEPVVAACDSPPYTNSAMDGYALRAVDQEGPLTIVGEVFASSQQSTLPELKPGTCVRIATGAPVPPTADAVVAVEFTARDASGRVILQTKVAKGASIRVAAEDIKAGAPLFASGAFLSPQAVLTAASLGVHKVVVAQKPKIGILSTGNELLAPGEPYRFGGVYNSTAPYIQAELATLGITPTLHRAADDVDSLASAIADLSDHDLIVSTGAVSAGERDLVPPAAAKAGFEMVFHKIAMRPGKPLFFACKGKQFWLGLPGNPISSMVCWTVFARELLAAAFGISKPVQFIAKLGHSVKKPQGLLCFYRGTVDSNGICKVSAQQGSGHFAASLQANVLVSLVASVDEVKEGTDVKVIAL